MDLQECPKYRLCLIVCEVIVLSILFFHVSPAACMDTWTYRTRNKIITFFPLPLFSESCNFLCYKESLQLSSSDTETWIRRKDGEKNDSFLSCKERKVIILRLTGDRAICWAHFSRVTFMQYTVVLQFLPFIQSETTTDLLTSRLTAPLIPEVLVS